MLPKGVYKMFPYLKYFPSIIEFGKIQRQIEDKTSHIGMLWRTDYLECTIKFKNYSDSRLAIGYFETLNTTHDIRLISYLKDLQSGEVTITWIDSRFIHSFAERY